MNPQHLAETVSRILGKPVTGAMTDNGGISLRSEGSGLFIQADNLGCISPENCAVSLSRLWNETVAEGVPEDMQRLLDRMGSGEERGEAQPDPDAIP